VLPVLERSTYLDLWARRAAEQMVVGTLNSTARTWRQAAAVSMRGGPIYAALQRELSGPVGARVRELVQRNAQLITSLPEKVAALAAQHAARTAAEGERFNEQAAELRHVARWQARLIARTETAKAQSALVQARAEELEVRWYVWRTSEDARVRFAHRRMDGVLVMWSDAPSPEQLAHIKSSLGRYNAGGAPNCRCYGEPLLRLTQVRWPCRVYYAGVIRRMTLADFRQLNHLPAREERLGIAA